MALYFLNYDLGRQQNYSRLYAELAEFHAVQVLESTWCFNRSTTTAPKLRDHFTQFIDAADGLCVTQVTDWATTRSIGTPNDIE